MATAQSIIDQVKTGMGPEELARKNSWKDLSGVNRDELLKTAVSMEEKQQSYNLLVYLFRISFDKDLWFSTEVLSQAVQHPIMTLLDHQAILPTLRRHLNKIKDEISLDPPPEEKLVKYWLMEANYYAINGNMLAETGKKAEAAQNYQIAQSIFEQLGQFQQASKFKVLSWRVQGNDIQKTPLPKTSPIKFRLPPTQPFHQTFPDYADSAEKKPESQKPTMALDPSKIEPATAQPAAETPSEPVNMNMPVEVAPPAQAAPVEPDSEEQAGKEQAGVEQIAEIKTSGVKVGEERFSEESINDVQVGEEQVGEAASSPTSPTNQNVSAAFTTQGEGLSSSEYYYPLPDVWMKDGQLQILGMEKAESDEAQRIKLQIEQECEILMGVQLLSQMYLTRRNVLEREVKKLELKEKTLRQRIDRLEKKTGKLENN